MMLREGAAKDQQCIGKTPLWSTIRLKVRAAFIAIITQQVCSDWRKYDPDFEDALQHSCLVSSYPYKVIMSASWWTDQGSVVTAHKVCGPGDGIYVLDGLEGLCVIRKGENSECVFKGLAPADLNYSHLNDSHRQWIKENYISSLGFIEIVRCMRYLDSSLSAEELAREHNAWRRGEDKQYPWITEDLGLVWPFCKGIESRNSSG